MASMAGGTEPKPDKQGPGEPRALFQSFLHGGTSTLVSSLATVIVFPVYKTIFRQQIHNYSVHQAVRQLLHEGPVKLYRGVAPPLLMKTLSGTLLFGLQDSIHHGLGLSSQNLVPDSALPALAGFGAGAVEAVFFTPFERVQNVLQNGQNDHRFTSLKSVLVRLKSERMASGFYRGFVPVAARNTLGSALYFGLKGPVCDAVVLQGLSPFASSFVSGTAASMATSLALYPLSVLVAKMQAQVGGQPGSVVACWSLLWRGRDRSVAQLYRGGSLVILRSCITWGLTTGLYDLQKTGSQQTKSPERPKVHEMVVSQAD